VADLAARPAPQPWQTITEVDLSETNEVEFLEPVPAPGSAPANHGPANRSTPVRIGIVVGAALLVVVGAVAAMGASHSPSITGADPSASATPDATQTNPGPAGMPGPGRHLGGIGDFGGFGRPGLHDISITAIDGSNVSLATDDGWTRTITVTSSTTITKGGATITVGDLAVGDTIRFAQTKASDGTYSITAIRVVLPQLGGRVTAIDGNTLTVTKRDGTTATIHVSGTTTYKVQGVANPTLSDIKVGAFVVAEGTLRSDGSLDASTIGSGFRGHGFKGDRNGDGQPDSNATSAPSTTPG
jgi:hypothetical protein